MSLLVHKIIFAHFDFSASTTTVVLFPLPLFAITFSFHEICRINIEGSIIGNFFASLATSISAKHLASIRKRAQF